MEDYVQNQPCDFVMAPLEDRATVPMEKIGDILHVMGLDVRIDRRRIPLSVKLKSWTESGAQAAILTNNENAEQGLSTLWALDDEYHRVNDQPHRNVVNALLLCAGMTPLSPTVQLPEGMAEEEEVLPDSPNRNHGGLTQGGPTESGGVLVESQPDEPASEIRSWPVGTNEYTHGLGPKMRENIALAKRNWSLGNGTGRFAVMHGDRIFSNVQQASEARGLSSTSLARQLACGATEWRGVRIGYADPDLEAIRVGFTREQWEAELGREVDDFAGRPESWPVGSNDYIECLGPKAWETIRKAKREWNLGKGRYCVFAGDRIYRSAIQAADALGIPNSTMHSHIRSGSRNLNGIPIGYADPELEAMRLRLTRREYLADGLPAAPAAPPAIEPVASVANHSIESWAAGDDSWRETISLKTAQTIDKSVMEWKLPGMCRFHVRRGDRIYASAKDAGMAYGEFLATGNPSPAFSTAMRAGHLEFMGEPIGFADPALEAIRSGKSREEFLAEGGTLTPMQGGSPEEPAEEPAEEIESAPIQSWPADTDEWRAALGAKTAIRIEQAIKDWKIPSNPSFPVIVGDRVYRWVTDAARSFNPPMDNGKLGMVLKKGVTEFRGKRLAFADPLSKRSGLACRRRSGPPAAASSLPAPRRR